MKSIHLIATLSAAAALAFPSIVTATAPPVKIFVLAGQSNMLGHGEMSPVTTSGTLEYITANDPEGTYQFLKTGPNWAVRTDVLIRDQNAKTGGLTTGYGAFSTTIGPELGFGHVVGDSLENPVLLVKCAWGGKSLAFDFCPPSSRIGAPAPAADGDRGFYYTEILRLLNEATTNLATYVPGYSDQGYEIAGFGWHQGWNDRVDGLSSAAYEVNMANFINDIRADLGVPNLPFVIATTGMDGKQGHGYTQVERAQLKMADPVAYPAFVGNVAVIDARATYEGLDFWQPTPFSPSPGGTQGFHWNRSAKTYLHLGLAMGDAMNLIAPGRTPYRLRSSGGSGGTILSWQNGTQIPTSVRVLRNGSEIAAAAPANPPTFTDAAAPPGTHTYELQFTMPGDPAAPLTITHSTGVADLTASYRSNGMRLTWKNQLAYSGIEVRRDGVLLATLAGSSTAFTDPAPPAGSNTYTVTPTGPGSPTSEVTVTATAASRGTATFYEPFDMTAGVPLAGQPAGIGIDTLWHADINVTVASGSFSFGALPTFGNRITRTTGNTAASLFMGDVLQDAGLISPGSELWFSFLTINPNNTGISPTFVIGNEAPTGSTNIANSGSAIGVRLNSGTQVQPMIYNNGSAAATGATQHTLTAGETVLVVGRIQWAATPGGTSSISVYTPASGTLELDTPTSVSAVIDPENFRILSLWGNTTAPTMDEIRFGATYEDVIGAGADTSGDLTPPTPAVMAFDTPPTAISETAITMTATTALDDNGVQYRFQNTTLGTYSLWQESRIFTATGLIPGTEYAFSVQARDKSVNQNTNTASPPFAVSTLPPDLTPPPVPAFAAPPAGLSTTAITMTATTVTDPEGTAVEYRFNNLTLGTSSGWQSSPNFIASGLEPATTYTFTVQARDSSFTRNESAPSTPANATTFAVTTTSGTWNVNAGGDWSNALNWLDTTVANGSGSTATIAMTTSGNRTIAVDSPRTIGNITRNWAQNSILTIGGPSLLTLEVLNGTPTITNNDPGGGRRMEITAPVAGTQGLQIAGGGLVLLNNNTTNFTGGGPASGRNITVQAGGIVRFTALSNAFLNRIVETTAEISVMTGSTNNALHLGGSTGANLPNAFLSNWASNGGKTELSGVITPGGGAYRLGAPNQSGALGITQACLLSGSNGLIIGGNRVVIVGAHTFTGDTIIRNGGRLGLAASGSTNSLALQNSILDLGSPAGTGQLFLEAATTAGPISGSNSSANGGTKSATFGGIKGSKNLVSAFMFTSPGNNTSATSQANITGFTLNVAVGKNPEYLGSIANFATDTTLTKTGPGTQTLSGFNTYTGATAVNEGTLALVGGSQQSDITVANGASLGFTLGSPTTSTKSVALGSGTVKITGTPNNTSDYLLMTASLGFTGSLNLAPDITGYELELRDNAKQLWLVSTGTPFSNWSNGAAPDADANNDGVQNAVAWALGAEDPNENAIDLLPTLDNTSDPTYVHFSFNRSNAAEADPNTAITVEFGNTLTGWTTAVDDNDNVEIETTAGSPKDTVVVKLKRSTLGADDQLFVRLRIMVTP
jgi:autotransporter-associated beta strand protein